MRLKVLLPTHVLLDQPATRIVAEGEEGAFGLLPRHVDFVAALRPGILTFTTPEGNERFVALDEGILVKRDREVLVSTRRAVVGQDLARLRQTVESTFRVLTERERIARSALARLEAGFIRRFLEIGEAR